MIPKIITATELRQNLAKFLKMKPEEIVVIKGKNATKVIVDQNYFNYLYALADQSSQKDPEGEYRPEFVEEILKIAKENKISNVKSIKELL
jgi:hypothetical protein